MKKIALSKETIRQLDEGSLRWVKGGARTDGNQCVRTIRSCATFGPCNTDYC